VSGLPRLLVIMGSGETSPTMVKTHRELLARLGPPPIPAVLLDTPFGFQMNAGDIAERAVEYFRESVGATIEVAGFRSAAVADDTFTYETLLEKLRAARYVFAGPGSPSYALRQWAGTAIPGLLADKLRNGGCVCFASAAALTLGVATVPVYEVYKVGEDPRWLPGLDLLSSLGLRAAVIPHYDNAEGGNHDTRFCYLGEERLSLLEPSLPPDAFVLGVDEHTGLILDLDAGSATIVGRSSVTIRKDGRSSSLPTGITISIAELAGMAGSVGSWAPAPVLAASPTESAQGPAAQTPFLEAVAAHEAAFAAAVESRDAPAAVRAILELDDEIVAWSRDTQQSDEMDRARAALRSMIVRLGQLAEVGARDPAEVVGPFVEALLSARTMARAGKRWDEADALRDRLVSLGVEVNDSPEGTSWRLLP
jgi:hypothetical protein